MSRLFAARVCAAGNATTNERAESNTSAARIRSLRDCSARKATARNCAAKDSIAAMTRHLIAGLLTALFAAGASQMLSAQTGRRGSPAPSAAAAIDWNATNAELLRHFQALVRIDT